MYLLATTTSAYSAFAGPEVSSDTCTRVCYITCRLLKHLTGRCTKGHDWQASKSSQHCCLHPYRYSQVRPGPVAAAAHQAVLARHTWASHIQARSHHDRLPAWSSSTVSTTVYRSPTLRHGSTFVQPVDVFWSYRITVSARMAAGLLLSLARLPGTLSRIISGIRTLPWTTSSACWKRFCSQRTSAISALDVSRWCAL